MGIEDRLRSFIADGLRPEVKTHALRYSEELEAEGWATLILDPHPDYPDTEPRKQSIGWAVWLRPMRGPWTGVILGGTFGTIDAALDDADAERHRFS